MSKLRAVLRRRWPILVAALLMGVAAGYFSAGRVGPERQTTQYQASQVIVANRLAGNPANVSQDALKVTRGEVPVVAAATLGDPDSAGLARKVRVSDDTDSRSISLTVTDPDSQRASEIVQAFTAAFLEVVNAELRSEDQRQLEQLNERVEEATVLLALFDQENAFIVRPDVPLPQTPTVDALVAERTRLANELQDAQNRLAEAELEISQREPYSTLGAEAPRVADSQRLAVPESPVFRATLLGLIGLFLGAGLVLLVERVNRRVDTREELAELIDVPILAEIGRIPNRRLPADDEGHVHLDGAWSEQYRRVRSAIEFVQTQAERSASANGAANGVNGSAGQRSPNNGEPPRSRHRRSRQQQRCAEEIHVRVRPARGGEVHLGGVDRARPGRGRRRGSGRQRRLPPPQTGPLPELGIDTLPGRPGRDERRAALARRRCSSRPGSPPVDRIGRTSHHRGERPARCRTRGGRFSGRRRGHRARGFEPAARLQRPHRHAAPRRRGDPGGPIGSQPGEGHRGHDGAPGHAPCTGHGGHPDRHLGDPGDRRLLRVLLRRAGAQKPKAKRRRSGTPARSG